MTLAVTAAPGQATRPGDASMDGVARDAGADATSAMQADPRPDRVVSARNDTAANGGGCAIAATGGGARLADLACAAAALLAAARRRRPSA